MSTRKCAHPRCRTEISSDLILCGFHWVKIPTALRIKYLASHRGNKEERFRALSAVLRHCRPRRTKHFSAEPAYAGAT